MRHLFSPLATMHCNTSVASRTRSRALIDKQNSHNVENRSVNDRSQVVGLSSDDDDDDDVVVWGEVPAKVQRGREEGASGSGSKHFDSGAAVSDDDSEEEEEDDDGDGDDDDQVLFLGEDFENCDDVEVERSKGESREEASVVGEVAMKRRTKYGLDILIDQNASLELKSVAQRTRSHFHRSKKQKFGTISQPICLDDDDDDDEQEQEEEQEEVEEQQEEEQEEVEEQQEEEEEKEEEEEESVSDSVESDLDDDSEEGSGSDEEECGGGQRKKEGYACVQKVNKKGGKLIGKKKHKKKRFDVVKILKDSIFGKREVPLVVEDMVEEEEPSSTMELPSRFSFSSEKQTPPKKSDEDTKLDEIWDEMERGLDSGSQACSLEEGRGSNEVKCRGSHWEKCSEFTRRNPAHDLKGFGGINNIFKDSTIYDKSEVSRECRGSHWEKCSAFTRRNPPHDLKGFGEINNVFQDSTNYDKGEVSREPSVEEGNSCVDLPLKFNFLLPKEPPAEKSEYEKEMDAIWAEMEYGLHVMQQENPAPTSQQVENNTDSDQDEYPVDDANTPPLFRCRKGKHNLVLDEEIGLICKYCLHVALEIKYWVPPFIENPCGKSERRDSYTVDQVDHSVFDEFQDRTSGYDDYNLCNQKGTVWDMIPGVKKTMYPHQCEAFEFLWSNIAGGILLDKLKEEPSGSGCIISHAPGTGKTRLTIVFLQTYMKLYPTCTPMIIAPKGMLLTWEEEFKTWKVDIPFHNLNNSEYSGNENEAAMNLIRKYGRNASTQVAKWYCRVAKLYSWKLGKSILGISYKLFEQLTRQGSRDKDLRKFLLEQPGLLVLDEGHTPRNTQTFIWKSVSEIQTKRRIILSGTPFQNNFDELYNTLCLARPKFAEWNPRNEQRGKWGYLTNSFGKVTDDSRRLKILKEIRSMIRPFVHVHKGTILQESLPGLRQLVVILKPTHLQKELLEDIQKRRKSIGKGKQRSLKLNVLKREYEESVTAFHPSLYDLSEDKKCQRFRLNPEESAKTKFLMELIRISGIFSEKVLVFSQFIEPLKLLTSQLKYHFSWTEGREVLQMHGKLEAKLRQASIQAFNDPNSKVRVMLASTRACYEGISLIGASRVVLLDVVWNPSVERQAINRAYRLGQKKFVYTYHLITVGTRDEEKCCRQAEKDQLSELVFFNSDGAQYHQNCSSAELEDEILEQMVQQEKFRHIFEKVAIKKQNLL